MIIMFKSGIKATDGDFRSNQPAVDRVPLRNANNWNIQQRILSK